MSTAANTGAALPKRLLICALGLLCYASGVAVTKNCELGISPIVSVAYVLSLITPITMGWCTTLVNLVFFLLQRLLLRREYPLWMMGAQFLMSVLFSVTIDLTAALFGFMAGWAPPYPARLAVFVLGCAVLALGVFLIVSADFVVLPAEGCVNAVVRRTGLRFGTGKVLFDGAMVAVTVAVSLLCFRQVRGIREGTLIAVVLIGTFARHIGERLGPALERHLAAAT